MQKRFPYPTLFLTHSGTGALEMIADLLDISEGDEIILPSYTFVSSVNAFASKGAIPVFVDIEKETWNISVSEVEKAISSKTKAVIAVHYGGHTCEMHQLKAICEKHSLALIEDAAMGYGSFFETQPLGSIGDFGIISFDITKQISAIQGGLLLVNNEKYKNRAENIYHIGTNRTQFTLGKSPYYEWVDVGSKYQMNELNAAVLFEQLQQEESLLERRKQISLRYYEQLSPLAQKGSFGLMPAHLVKNNIHVFYILTNSLKERQELSDYLELHKIESFFHYIPLHSSSFGLKKGRKIGDLQNTELVSNCLLRLPLHAELTNEEVNYVCLKIRDFYNGK